MKHLLLFLTCAFLGAAPSVAQFSALDVPTEEAEALMKAQGGGATGVAPSSLDSRFNLLYSEYGADGFTAGLHLYPTPPSWDAGGMSGSRRRFLTWKIDTSAVGTLTTSYRDPISHRPVTTLQDDGFKKLNRAATTVNVQLTGSTDPEHVVLYTTDGIGARLVDGTTLLRAYSPGGDLLLKHGVSSKESTFFVARQFDLEGRQNFDLNGNGLHELISFGSPGFLDGRRIFVYDDFEVIDSLEETRGAAGHFQMTTTNDLNGDGRPELVMTAEEPDSLGTVPGLNMMTPHFYQFNPSTSRFEKIGGLGGTKTFWTSPVNLDADSETETFAVSGLLGEQLLVYGQDFRRKYGVKAPGFAGVMRYFIANINETPNDELIVVQQMLHPKWLYINGTAIFDFSVSMDPIRIDTTFEAFAVGDFRGTGKMELLGARRLGPGYGTYGDRSLELQTPIDSYKTEWSVHYSDKTFATLSGPFRQNDDAVTDFWFMLSYRPLLDLDEADANGDGRRDFVVETYAPGGFYGVAGQLVVDVDGNVLGQLDGPGGGSRVLAHDFNANGRDELVVSYKDNTFRNDDTTRVWLFEWDGVSTAAETETPRAFALEQNYPNPFNPATILAFSLAAPQHVTLNVYDPLGRRIATLADGHHASGRHEVRFDATGLPSGVYVYRIEAGSRIETRRMTLVR